MTKISRSKERVKQTGEVFTPLPLVDEILQKLPQDLFKDPTKTYLDNSCGDGNFLVRVVAFKIFYGSTPKQALSTTYGVEFMSDNATHCRQRLLTHAYASTLCQGTLLPHMSHDDEHEIQTMTDFEKFTKQYYKIVKQNIVCHDALTYDYSFK